MIFKVIRLLLSLALLFAMLYLGKLVAYFLPIGISDSIWGMILLFACLVIGIVKVEWVTPSARPLTRYMTLFLFLFVLKLLSMLMCYMNTPFPFY